MRFINILLLISLNCCIFPSFLSISARDKIMFHFDNDDKFLGNRQRLANKILYDTSSYVKNKYKMQTASTSMGMNGNAPQKLGLSFNSYENLSIEVLRKTILEIGQKLLDIINANEEFQPFMTKWPFTIENINISICCSCIVPNINSSSKHQHIEQ